MSKAVRKQLFEILDTLQQANDMLEGLFTDASNNSMVELLTDCQNCAITIGNKIEAVYGEGTESVKALEEYCESIYLVSQSFEQPAMCHQYYVNSKEQLQAVTAHMEREIPDKKEIVFMPYKASMWDSLESVYLAAKEDETCEAYVVPIPYFDRKPDKSLGEMHYEGAEYPKNIPITDWEQYNFEERCPDVIYIHNAYDDMNLVTCVHPRFFSSNLKKYTEELIYIPYFVLEEIEPDDQKKIDNMKHFCVLPGIIHADKVILQSEKMSQIYINEYAKALEAAGVKADREQLKQKFLGLGSPKFDKVVNTKKEDVEVPSEWLRIITKPDGTWKKIVFYNTSVTALLKHEEKMLTKMKNVFEIFKERQDEVALLWRPHPLIRTTIEAMRPQLWEEYSKIVEQYKTEGWGIYDDTADIDRAIALSDAYYGDHSSLVPLCQKAGMPVMVQDVWVNTKNNFPISMDCAYQEESDLWFVDNNDNSVWHMNLNDKRIQYVNSIDTNSNDTFRMHPRCMKYKDSLIFLPDRADSIVIYNLENNDFKYCYIDSQKARIGIYNSWIIEDTLWCVSYFMREIIEINLVEMKIKGRYFVFETDGVSLGYEAAMHEGKIYCVSSNSTMISEFDINDRTKQYYGVSVDDTGFNTIAIEANQFYLTGYTKKVYIWRPKCNEAIVPKELPEQYVICDDLGKAINSDVYDVPIFYRSIITDAHILFLPWNYPGTKGDGMVLYDKVSKSISIVEGKKYLELEKGYCLCYKGMDSQVGVFCAGKGEILEIDNKGRTKYANGYEMCNGDKYFDMIRRTKKIIDETNSYRIENFLVDIWKRKFGRK